MFALCCAAFGVLAAPLGSTSSMKASSQTRISKTGRSAVTVVESVLAGTQIPTINLFSGPVGVTGQGMAMVPSQSSASGDSSFLGLPSVAVLPLVDGAATKDQILSSAKRNILPSAADVVARLRTLMTAQGYKSANFIFEQPIKPAGSASYVKVVWQVTVLESGRVIYADPRIMDPDPYYVYATYTSKQVAAGLPSSWAFADGGKFKWQLVKKDGTPLTDLNSIDVSGAFDVPMVADGTSYDPDWGVKCLANVASDACPTVAGFVDVKTLVSKHSAAGAVIDYTRKLEPAYASKGDGTQQAVMSISFDSRNLHHNNSCTNSTFRTKGRYGLTLNSTYDRFSYDGLSAPVLMGRSSATTFSPTQAFDNSLATALSVSGLGNFAINPFDPSSGLVDASTIVGVKYIAPISQDGDTGKSFYTVTVYAKSMDDKTRVFTCDIQTSQAILGTYRLCGQPWWNFWSGSKMFFVVIDSETGQGYLAYGYYDHPDIIEAVPTQKTPVPCP